MRKGVERGQRREEEEGARAGEKGEGTGWEKREEEGGGG